MYGGPDAPYTAWPSVCTIYDGLMPIAEFDTSGNVLARYYHEGLGRPLRVEKGGDAWTVLTDDRGSVMGVVDITSPSCGIITEQLYYNLTGCLLYTSDAADE